MKTVLYFMESNLNMVDTKNSTIIVFKINVIQEKSRQHTLKIPTCENTNLFERRKPKL